MDAFIKQVEAVKKLINLASNTRKTPPEEDIFDSFEKMDELTFQHSRFNTRKLPDSGITNGIRDDLAERQMLPKIDEYWTERIDSFTTNLETYRTYMHSGLYREASSFSPIVLNNIRISVFGDASPVVRVQNIQADKPFTSILSGNSLLPYLFISREDGLEERSQIIKS
ncbi:hypothetical protein CVT25_004156 [Psilocybe cyanescens]|uniref:Uncharacterized protein n=1 Tax=Psilocybe cyanescens TaxID=93625 RepID=A0A409XKT6_PSICY|nr:hypothetical protein CVT25_004156 [Psilocybe cyanescens]